MVMWKVTVAPDENRINAWTTFVQQAVIGIGWPDRACDNNSSVKRFQRIEVDDWIVAHVPPTHGAHRAWPRE
jgi:hypothetical protein